MKLLKTFAAFAFAFYAALTHAAETDPPGVVGRLSLLEGPVSFAPAQANEDWAAGTLNRPVTSGDRLWTDSGGRAEIHVGSLAIRMSSQTSLDVLNLDDRTLQVRLAQGSVSVRARRLSSGQQIEIATPGGAVVVRQPGVYRISVDASGAATTVAVRGSGQADVFTGISSFAVRDNQQVAISGSTQNLYAVPPPDEFDQWAAARDQREDRVVSARYVPEEMTGYEDLDQYGAWQTAPDYGAVWIPSTVPAGWAPYRQGHWVWVSPWGWTWVDDAPWGFAPFHYGRWVWFHSHWAWTPGRRVARPVYAPALVAFIGGSNFSVAVGVGRAQAVGWVPLGWREPYIPWYRASRAHVQNVNIMHVTNVTNITGNVTHIRYVNRNVPSGVTVVSRENFVAARPVQQAALNVPVRTLNVAPVTRGSPVAAPARTSLAASRPGSRPPEAVATREAVAVSAPPARSAAGNGRTGRGNAPLAGNGERPHVRVIDRQQRVNLPMTEAQRAAAPAPQAAPQLPRAGAAAQSASDAQRKRESGDRADSRTAGKAAPPPSPRLEPGRAGERPQESRAGTQAERRAPGPPPEVSKQSTADRDVRGTPPAPTARSAVEPRQRQVEEQRAREQARQLEEQRIQRELQRAQRQAAQQQEREQQARQARTAQQLEHERQQQAQRQQAQQQQAQQARAQQQQRAQQQAHAQQAQQQQAQQQQAQQQRAQQLAQRQQAEQRQAQQQSAQQQHRDAARKPPQKSAPQDKDGRQRARPEKAG